DAAHSAAGIAQQRSYHGFFEPRDAGANDLLAAQVHERDAGIALHVRRDAADLAWAGDHVPGVVPPKIQACFLELRIIDALDPLAAAACPALVDQKLVVIFDEEFSCIARLLVGVAEQLARDHQISSEQRRAAFADQALAYDERGDALLVQTEGGIAARRSAADNRDVCLDPSHRRRTPLASLGNHANSPTSLRNFAPPSAAFEVASRI